MTVFLDYPIERCPPKYGYFAKERNSMSEAGTFSKYTGRSAETRC
jgi:hypothetical protein